MSADHEGLKGLVRDVADFPQAGVTYRDITPLLGDPGAYGQAVEAIAELFADTQIDRVVGVEARGFIFGASVAYRSGAGFIPVRKAGKLPWQVVREDYQLEYGSDKLEIHRDAIRPDERILIVDDVLATGGTALATAKLVETLGGEVVGLAFLIELDELDGRAKLGDRTARAVLHY